MHNFKTKHLRTEQQKMKSQNHCSEQGAEEQAVLCCGCTQHRLHVPPHSSVPFPWLTFHLSHHFRLLFLNAFISASRRNVMRTETVQPLEVEQTRGCAASFVGGMEGLEHFCLRVWCCETSCTLLPGVRLQHPKGLSSPFLLKSQFLLKPRNILLQSGSWLQADGV